MKRITFTRTELYESEGRGKGPTFEAGSTHNFEDHFADRWLRRGVAVEASPDAAPAQSPVASVPVVPVAIDSLDDKSFPDIKKLALAAGITVGFGASKAKLIDAIRAKG